MAMFKGLLGGAAGAAMYSAYRDSDAILNSKDLATGLYDYWQKRGAANLSEMSRLQKNVDDLQHALLKSLHDRQHPTVIVAGGGGRSGASTAAGVVLVIGGVAVYLRFVKGWRLQDLMYVTRSSLSSLSESMKHGMDTMRSQLEARAADLMERMGALGSKQEELLEAQGALGSELADVGARVAGVSEQVGFSNHAILLLCGALSEMAKRVGISNGKYVRELESLSRSVAITGLPHHHHAAGDPFEHAAMLTAAQPAAALPAPQAAAGAAAAAPRPNPAIYSLGPGGSADGGAGPRAQGGLADVGGVRGLGDAQAGLANPWGSGAGGGRQGGAQPLW